MNFPSVSWKLWNCCTCGSGASRHKQRLCGLPVLRRPPRADECQFRQKCLAVQSLRRHGGMLALYAKLNHTTTSDAYWEIAEALCDNTHEEHARSGNEAPQQPASTGSPSSGGPGGRCRSFFFRAKNCAAIGQSQPGRDPSDAIPAAGPAYAAAGPFGNICARQSAGCLMNKSRRWALRVPRRPSYAALSRTG